MLTDHLLLRRSLGSASPKDYINWAVGLLEEGFDTPGLRILAGLNPKIEHDEIAPWFQKTCKELNIDVSSIATPREAAILVKKLYDYGNVSAEEAIYTLESLYVKSNYSEPLLKIFMYIVEEIGLGEDEFTEVLYPLKRQGSLERVFRTEWELFDRAIRLNLPKGYNRFIWCSHCGFIGEPKIERGSLLDRIKTNLSVTELPLRKITCPRCGSMDCKSMLHPEARDAYYKQLEEAE